jgi:protoporphyrinogen oxidase
MTEILRTPLEEPQGLESRDPAPPARQFVIIGGGPAGLTAAYELSKLGIHPIVIEKRDKVGGISRTEKYNDYYFDMGGHRFFTKVPEVNQFWCEILGADFLRRPRLSRIYYRKRFLYYPLRPLNTLRNLGVLEGASIVLSYIRWQLFPSRQEETFAQWVTNRFGRQLFDTFFRTYTEKVWGISTNQLSAEWAAQRIKNLSLGSAILSMAVKPQAKIVSLIEEFDYPRYGPGMMWKTAQAEIERRGGRVLLNAEVVRICRSGNRITGVVLARDAQEELIEGTDFISSMALRELIERMDAPPSKVLEAAQALHYRDLLTVCLIVDKPDLFPDNWIYVHDPDVRVGRIQNFKNWSPEMVPDPAKTSVGLEYFCNEGDELWNTPDAELVELGKRELAAMGLARGDEVIDGCVFRVEKSYPVYVGDYRQHVSFILDFLGTMENFATIGRNGLHRYDNQDHAMLTAMLAVRNVVFGEKNDLRQVNADAEYQEEMREAQTRKMVRDALGQRVPMFDAVALGAATGLVTGLLLLLATLFLVLKGGPVVGPNLALLSQILPFYDVTPLGSLLGFLYGGALGFIAGWLYAFLRNVSIVLSLATLEFRAKWRLLWGSLDWSPPVGAGLQDMNDGRE